MNLTDEQIKLLEQPIDPRRVHQREGSGRQKLSYLWAHDVKRHANRVFGFDGWSYHVTDLQLIAEEPVKKGDREGFRVGYRAIVEVRVGTVLRGDTGYGDAMEYTGNRITPHELASKEAVSDALKRCLASFGSQFGLDLYGEDPAPAPPPKPDFDQPSDDEMRELIAKAKARGYQRDQIATLLSNEREQHGAYRKAWWDEQMAFLTEAAA
jgi:DNA recombination protein Rad52